MATKTFYLKAAAASGSNFGSLQDGGTAPTRVANTGFTVGTTAANNYALMWYAASRTAASFAATSPLSTSTGPSNTSAQATAWRSENTLTGTFEPTSWTLNFPIRSTSGTAHRGAMRVRVWASTDATGQSNKRELTSGVVQGTTLSTISTTVDTNSVVTWTPTKHFSLSSEYLFVQCEWLITTAGSASGAALVISDGAAATIVTSEFNTSLTTRTNYILNNTSAVLSSAPSGNGVTGAIIASGTLADGARYEDVQFTGTATSDFFGDALLSGSSAPAFSGNVFTLACDYAVISGAAPTGGRFYWGAFSRDSTATYLAEEVFVQVLSAAASGTLTPFLERGRLRRQPRSISFRGFRFGCLPGSQSIALFGLLGLSLKGGLLQRR
jgi:hypothetical protein